MIRSHAADSTAVSRLPGYPARKTAKSRPVALPHRYLAPIEALAEHLHTSPADVGDFLQHAKIVPPTVLLSWICAWDLKRRSE